MHSADYGMGHAEPASFGMGFVRSEAFSALFHEGMDLIEEAAAYLEGRGAIESAPLEPELTLVYTHESVQLTSRLMQIASWLLVQRELADGSVTMQETLAERRCLHTPIPNQTPPVLFDALPQAFRDLVGLTSRLHTRIQHLETLLLEADGVAPETGNPVAEQRWLIERAFARAN